MQASVKMYCPFVIFQHGGGMSHGEHHMMSDGYRPINETFSQCQVNLQTQFGVAELNVSYEKKTFISSSHAFECEPYSISSFFLYVQLKQDNALAISIGRDVVRHLNESSVRPTV